MQPTPTEVRHTNRVMSLSQQEPSVPPSMSMVKSKRALTSFDKPGSPNAVKTYGSGRRKPSQNTANVFEYRGSSDGEVDVSPYKTRRHNGQSDVFGLEGSDGQFVNDARPLVTGNDCIIRHAVPATTSKPQSHEHTQQSEENAPDTISDLTSMLYQGLPATTAKATSADNEKHIHLSISDGRTPSPTMSSYGRTNEGKSSKDAHASEAPEALADGAGADYRTRGNHHEPTSSALVVSPSNTPTVRKSTTRRAELQIAEGQEKDELHTIAGSAGPDVIMPVLSPAAQPYHEASLPTLPARLEERSKISKDRKRKRQDDDRGDELGSDDVFIGLPKEKYQPRLSRSRGSRNEEIVVPTDYSKRPEALVNSKRKSKRCRTTAFHELIPKEEEEVDDEKPPPENPDLHIPEFAKNKAASDGFDKTMIGDGMEQRVGVNAPEKPSVQKKQRGRPKKSPQREPVHGKEDGPDGPFGGVDRPPEQPDAEKTSKRGRPSKKSTSSINEDWDADGEDGIESAEPASQTNGDGRVLEETSPNVSLPAPSETAFDASLSSPQAVSPLATPQKPLAASPKGPDKHSPINSGKVAYRVGLSKRARIEPLLRIVRK